jgi:hypothetical protein
MSDNTNYYFVCSVCFVTPRGLVMKPVSIAWDGEPDPARAILSKP